MFIYQIITFDIQIQPAGKLFYESGDNIDLLLDLETSSSETIADVYFILLNEESTMVYYGTEWDVNPHPALKNFTLPANVNISDALLLDMTIPSIKPPISEVGTYTFAIAATEPGTLDFVSNIATVSFEVK